MKMIEFDLPEFLLADIPIKTGSADDGREFIYHTKTQSLIEAIPLDIYPDFMPLEGLVFAKFKHGIESYMLVFHKNNVEFTSDFTPQEVLDMAWAWYEKYLIWEDAQGDRLN